MHRDSIHDCDPQIQFYIGSKPVYGVNNTMELELRRDIDALIYSKGTSFDIPTLVPMEISVINEYRM